MKIAILFFALLSLTFSSCSSNQDNKPKEHPDLVDPYTFHRYIIVGDYKNVNKQLELGMSPDQEISNKITPLMTAAFKNKVDIMTLLIEKKANIDAQSAKGWTAVTCAADKGHVEALTLLIEYKANINLRLEGDENALFKALTGNNPKCAKLLLSNGPEVGTPTKSGLTELMVAADIGDLESTKLLLDKFNNINETNHYGETTLIRATIKGHQDIVAYLVEMGADKTKKDKLNKTAFDWAEEKSDKELTNLLRE